MNYYHLKYFAVAIFLFLLNVANTFAQEGYTRGSTDWLVDMFFVQPTFNEKDKYFTGEMLEEINNPTIGEELKGQARVSFKNLLQDDSYSIYTVAVKMNEKIIDFYCYLIFTENAWKINAVRRFLLPPFIYAVYDSLSQENVLSSNDSSLFKLLTLVTANDEKLKNYLQSNTSQLSDLVSSFLKEDNETLKVQLNKMNLDAIYKDVNYPGCVFIQIGRFETREVGFIYTEQNAMLPQITPSRFIYIEEILPGWFIYRSI